MDGMIDDDISSIIDEYQSDNAVLDLIARFRDIWDFNNTIMRVINTGDCKKKIVAITSCEDYGDDTTYQTMQDAVRTGLLDFFGIDHGL